MTIISPSVPAAFVPGTRVWSRQFGAGTVSALELKHACVVHFDRFGETEVFVRVGELFTVFPPEGEGWEPNPDSTDPRDVFTYSGPVLTAGRASVAQEWSPEDGVTYWISGEPFFTLDDLRNFAGLLNGLLAEVDAAPAALRASRDDGDLERHLGEAFPADDTVGDDTP